PTAPRANSLVPAASAVVVDKSGRIVLQRRRDNEMWALPGGAMELGESVAQCAIRETREETGLDVEVTGVVGIYSDPKHVFAYDDGEVRQEFSICVLARVVGGAARVSDESHEVRAFAPDEIEDLPMVPSIRLRVSDYLSGQMPAIR
ncbi:NUDIX domain-containing protein, partial [Salmonella enterica subsp. enterica serovar Senftenberg]|nr:NUDIX domain-containing protein [Salmonella enterica subsp. enterica serovar Senftenberg]